MSWIEKSSIVNPPPLQLFRPGDASEGHEVLEVDAVSPPRPLIVNVGEPLDLGGHLSQGLKLKSPAQKLEIGIFQSGM